LSLNVACVDLIPITAERIKPAANLICVLLFQNQFEKRVLWLGVLCILPQIFLLAFWMYLIMSSVSQSVKSTTSVWQTEQCRPRSVGDMLSHFSVQGFGVVIDIN